MSKPTDKITRTIRSEQVLNAFVEIVRPNLPLELKNTRITATDIIYALAYANVHRLSIASACQELQGAPSGNRLREVLVEALPKQMADIVRWLIKRVKALKIRIRRVFLDKGFCSKPVFKVFSQHKLSYIVPIPVRGKSGGVRSLSGQIPQDHLHFPQPEIQRIHSSSSRSETLFERTLPTT